MVLNNIFTASHGNIDGVRAFERTLNVIVDLRGSLTQVGPQFGMLEETMLVGSFGGPNYSSRCSRRVQTSTSPLLAKQQSALRFL